MFGDYKPAVVSTESRDTTPPHACPECGSERLEYLCGYFATGVTGPNGEPEMHWQEGLRCLDCGAVEEF